jgi:hypothetical protein
VATNLYRRLFRLVTEAGGLLPPETALVAPRLDALQIAEGDRIEAVEVFEAVDRCSIRSTELWSVYESPNIGTLVNDAMVAIERDDPPLKGVLPGLRPFRSTSGGRR